MSGGGLTMPRRGQAATMLADLNAAEAPKTETAAIEVTNVTTLQRSHDATLERDNLGAKHRSHEPNNERSNEGANEVAVVSTNAPAKQRTGGRTGARAQERTKAPAPAPALVGAAERVERLARALQIAAEDDGGDEIEVVTVRAPRRLAQYIDRYVERMKLVDPKRKYRKQDAVAEMFAAFYAEHPMPPAPEEEI